MTTQDQGKGQQQLAQDVFQLIVGAMCADNCCDFDATEDDLQEALPHIQELIASGYFAGDLKAQADDIDGDIWMAAAGELREAERHFAGDLKAYQGLSDVLNRIFDSPLKDPPLNRYRIVQDGRHVGDIEAVDARVAASKAVETYGCGVFDVSLVRGADDSVEWQEPSA